MARRINAIFPQMFGEWVDAEMAQKRGFFSLTLIRPLVRLQHSDSGAQEGTAVLSGSFRRRVKYLEEYQLR